MSNISLHVYSDRFDEILSNFNQSSQPGLAVGVSQNGKTIYKKGFGLADVDSMRIINSATNFRIASLTKQFTAMSIMFLKDQGVLNYNDTLKSLFPEFPSYANFITVKHLLQNQGGLKDYEDLIPASQVEQLVDHDVLQILSRQQETQFLPGSQYRYSNGGYVLLSLIVNRLSGLTFPEFLKQKIFQPLGMKSSVAFESGVSTVSNRAYGYSPIESGFHQTDQSITSATIGDGGIYSSIDDLLLWERELLYPTIVKEETLKEAFLPGLLNDGSSTSYGFGWMISKFHRHPRIGHTGSSIGFRAAIQRYVAHGVAIIILSNRSDLNAWAITEKIAAVE